MPTPERSCETCQHYRPYEGKLREAYAKCRSPKRPATVEFAETCRGMLEFCGPNARWWEAKPAVFEVVDDGPRELEWDDEEEDV